jgi:hypothetical protein
MIRGTMLKKEYYLVIVTETTEYARRAANSRAANRPVGGLPPEGRIILTL